MTQLLTFRLGHEWYGVALAHVSEVLLMMALHEVPDDGVLGMMTLRDRVLPVVDLREVIGMVDPPLAMDTPMIAVNYDGHLCGFVVDEVEAVVDALPDDSPYTNLYIQQVYKNGDHIIFELDLGKVIARYHPQAQVPPS